MPIFIAHRINKVNDLLKVNPKDGIETDIRDFNKKLTGKLHERFSGIKTKDKGDGIMEISFK